MLYSEICRFVTIVLSSSTYRRPDSPARRASLPERDPSIKTLRPINTRIQSKVTMTTHEKSEIIPGTEVVFKGSGDVEGTSTDELVLIPQPSSNSDDPLVSGIDTKHLFPLVF